ncbi:alkaline phosphatase [Marmoricola sp. URHB0036]|uniref:alkaline phosphatase D family protein n=1 Tax=Marmoricola sp. URHB0036 TaxID=1298863 RepID=UPI00056D9DDA|nr:alkaline phosphatase D family protein [Marmoricola sp. URHB0036]
MPIAQFAHGVASGDPRPSSVIIWTRVTPTSASKPGSGVGPDVTVRWQVSTTSTFTSVVRSGDVRTGPARDHTIKVDVTGLLADTTYYYRFVYGSARSASGRARTAPGNTSSPANVRLGVVSCANYQAGWFSAYRHLGNRNDLHAILHLGDYIYEYGPGEYGYGQNDVDIRKHSPAHEVLTLADYRQRHAQYKLDPDLQRLHAKYAFIATWDDHEVADDAWKGGAVNENPGEPAWATRRAAAYQAYDEWQPVRLSGTAALGDGTQIYRRLQYGDLVEISLLDLRTYRDQQLAVQADPATADPDRTITGRAQLDWLKDSLTRQATQWKLVGNPVMISPVTFAGVPRDLVKPINDTAGLLPPEGVPYNVDQWDGYTDDRREVFEHLRDNGVTDALFVTGDIHSGWAADLPADKATYAGTRNSVGVEFVGTSVTSNNLCDITGTPPRTTSIGVEEILKANNPHLKYIDFDDHGFSVLDITAKRAQMDWFVIGDRADKNAGVTWSVSWATTAGSQTIHAVDGPVA